MLTMRLWTLFAQPARRHPLYRRLLMPRPVASLRRLVVRVVEPIAPIVYLFSLLFLCCGATSRSMGLFILAGVAGILLFNGTLLGAQWASVIAAELSRIRASGEWDLLSLAPVGALGTVWAAATGVLHREQIFRKRYARHVTILRVALTIVVVISIGSLLDPHTVSNDATLGVIVTVLFVLAASYVDYVQSVVLGTVVGLFAGTRTHSRLDAQLWALILFLALQIGVYLVTLIVGFGLLPSISLIGALGEAQRALLLAVLRLVLFVGSREFIIAALWNLLADDLNTNSGQLMSLVRPAT
jgi:hypothetical protein